MLLKSFQKIGTVCLLYLTTFFEWTELMKAGSDDFNVSTHRREEVIPLLPALYQWSLAFQNPPYSFAGFHEDDIIEIVKISCMLMKKTP
jgi:hypothetical protein